MSPNSSTRWTLLARLGAIALAVLAANADAAALRVGTSGGTAAAMAALVPEYERISGDTVEVVAGASMGATPEALPNRLRRGESLDVVVMVDSGLDGLIQSGLVDAASKVQLARSLIAVAVKAGAPRPDISSADAVRKTLLAAKSIAYSDSASGNYLQSTLFPKMGIAEAVRDRSRMIASEPVGQVVARGEAEIGFQQMAELLPVKGIDIVGPLPESIQLVTPYSTGKVSATTHAEAAQAFIRFMASPEAAVVLRKTGLDPLVKP